MKKTPYRKAALVHAKLAKMPVIECTGAVGRLTLKKLAKWAESLGHELRITFTKRKP